MFDSWCHTLRTHLSPSWQRTKTLCDKAKAVFQSSVQVVLNGYLYWYSVPLRYRPEWPVPSSIKTQPITATIIRFNVMCNWPMNHDGYWMNNICITLRLLVLVLISSLFFFNQYPPLLRAQPRIFFLFWHLILAFNCPPGTNSFLNWIELNLSLSLSNLQLVHFLTMTSVQLLTLRNLSSDSGFVSARPLAVRVSSSNTVTSKHAFIDCFASYQQKLMWELFAASFNT